MAYQEVKLATTNELTGIVWSGGVIKDHLNPPRKSLKIDGFVVKQNDLILVKDQKEGRHNGVYKVTRAAGNTAFKLSRRFDVHRKSKFTIYVKEGTQNKKTHWEMIKPTSSNNIINFRRFTYLGEEKEPIDPDALKNSIIQEVEDYIDERNEMMAKDLTDKYDEINKTLENNQNKQFADIKKYIDERFKQIEQMINIKNKSNVDMLNKKIEDLEKNVKEINDSTFITMEKELEAKLKQEIHELLRGQMQDYLHRRLSQAQIKL